MQSLQAMVEGVRDIAKQAAARILEIYTTNFVVQHKDDRSPLTAADMAAHQSICTALAAFTPELPVLSEESAALPYTERQKWSRYWLIDPLDGTREFIKRNDEFTVNIGLIENNRAILGVIYVPVSGVCYFATKHHGAFKIEENGTAEPLQVKNTGSTNLVLVGSRSHSNEKQRALISRLNEAKVITVGSSLKFCLIAEGKADIYPRFGFTSEWDTAAAQCIVEEAGGCVVDLDFKPIRYNTKDSLLNPDFLAIADRSFGWQKFLRPPD